jgi:hypothetical protein
MADMPAIYTLRCDACGCEREALSYHRAVQFDDGRVQPLHHPGERYALAGLGFDDEELAYAEGRMLQCEEQICRHCGGITVYRKFVKVHWPAPSPMRYWGITALLGLASGLAVWMAFRLDAPWAAGLAAALAYGVVRRVREWSVERRRLAVLKQRSAHRRPPLPVEHCCDAPDVLPVHEVDASARLPCPECGAPGVRCVCTGIC